MKRLDFLKRFVHKIAQPLLYNNSPKWLSSPEYAKKFPAKWHKVYDKMPNKRPHPVYYGANRVDLQRRLDPEFPEAGVLELNNALIYRNNGWIFSKEGYFLPDHSWYGRHIDEIRMMPRFIPRGKSLKGVCLSLASDFGVKGYGHFLIDCLPRLELFNQAGFKLTDVDYIVCPKPTPGNASHLFDKLDIPVSKCIWADYIVAIRPDTLLAPTFPGTRRNYPKWVIEFLQREFLSSPTTLPTRRLYVTRSGYKRNPLNEEAVNRIFIKYGFEIYNPIHHVNSHQDFSEAAIVVGVSGSALSGLAFCQPGTKVLELIPSDHVYPYYYTLADAAGLDYAYLVCLSQKERDPDAWGPSSFDFYVNEQVLDSTLAIITGQA